MLAELHAYLAPATSELPPLRAGNLTEDQALLAKAAACAPVAHWIWTAYANSRGSWQPRCSRASAPHALGQR
jgi:hypothetical protein